MSETTSRSVVERFKAPQVCDWEIHRPTIARLYLEEGKPLKEVISILHEQHGFQATPRQYKQRIKAWGLQKNYRPEDVDDLLQHYTKDELQNKVQNGHGSSLMVKGKRLSVSDVKRYLRRIKPLEIPADSRKSPLSSSKSENFIFASPSTAPNVRSNKREEPTPSPYRTRFSTPPALTTRGAYLDVRSTSPSNISTEAFTTDKSSYEHEKEESDTQRKRRRLSKPGLASSLDTRALACPFYKHNPWIYNPQNEDMESAMRYRTCAGPGWESISRLRQHLFRAHAHVTSKRCRLCGSGLQSGSDFDNHSLVCRANVATDLISSSETMSEEQQHGLKLKQLPGLTKEQSWMRIYNILFPQDSCPPSPYYQSDHETLMDTPFADPKSGQLDALIEHLCNNLPQKILTGWQGYLTRQGEPLSAGMPTGSAQRPDTSSRARSQESAEKRTLIDPPSSATAQELKSLVSESITETCTEWVRSRKAQDDDSDQESETENDQSHAISILAPVEDPSPNSLSMVPHDSGYLSGLSTDRTSTSFTDPNMVPWTLQQPFISPEWLTRTLGNDSPSYGLPNLSILDGDFNPAPAAAAASSYDFSYLPISPGTQFFDDSMQADAAASGNLGGSARGAFTDLIWPIPQSGRNYGQWQETDMPADTTASMPPKSNSEP